MKDLEKYKIKDQKLEELRKQELIPDSTNGLVMMKYVSAINEVMSLVDRDDELSHETKKHLTQLQSHLKNRLENLINIEYEVA